MNIIMNVLTVLFKVHEKRLYILFIVCKTEQLKMLHRSTLHKKHLFFRKETNEEQIMIVRTKPIKTS